MSVQYVAELDIDAGEERYIRAVVKPVCEQDIPFVIREARYELLDRADKLVSEGECEITDHEIAAFLSFQDPGVFRLKLIYKVGNETWVDNIRLKVG